LAAAVKGSIGERSEGYEVALCCYSLVFVPSPHGCYSTLQNNGVLTLPSDFTTRTTNIHLHQGLILDAELLKAVLQQSLNTGLNTLVLF